MKSRIMVWVLIALALVTQVIAGAAGPDALLCVCSSGLSIEHRGEPCCAGEAGGPEGRRDAPIPVGPAGCPDCHLTPLPDAVALSESLAPIVLPAAILPITPVAWSVIVWPPATKGPVLSDQKHPPPHLHLRFLRTVVITC